MKFWVMSSCQVHLNYNNKIGEWIMPGRPSSCRLLGKIVFQRLPYKSMSNFSSMRVSTWRGADRWGCLWGRRRGWEYWRCNTTDRSISSLAGRGWATILISPELRSWHTLVLSPCWPIGKIGCGSWVCDGREGGGIFDCRGRRPWVSFISETCRRGLVGRWKLTRRCANLRGFMSGTRSSWYQSRTLLVGTILIISLYPISSPFCRKGFVCRTKTEPVWYRRWAGSSSVWYLG